MSIEALRSIFRVNLGVKKSERVLVFADKPPRGEPITDEDLKLLGIAGLAAELGGGLTKALIYSVYPVTGGHGKEPPAALSETDLAAGPGLGPDGRCDVAAPGLERVVAYPLGCCDLLCGSDRCRSFQWGGNGITQAAFASGPLERGNTVGDYHSKTPASRREAGASALFPAEWSLF